MASNGSPLPLVVGVGAGLLVAVGLSRAAFATSGDVSAMDIEALRKRARGNQQSAATFLPAAQRWAKEFKFPASLMMALMSIESGYNPLNVPPAGASDWAGDRGGAWGPAQMLLKTAQGLTKNNPKTAAKYWPQWDGTGKGLQDVNVSLPMAGFAIGQIFNHYRANANAWMLSGLAWNRGQGGVDKLLAANNIPGPGVKYYSALLAQRSDNPIVKTLVESEKKGGYVFA